MLQRASSLQVNDAFRARVCRARATHNQSNETSRTCDSHSRIIYVCILQRAAGARNQNPLVVFFSTSVSTPSARFLYFNINLHIQREEERKHNTFSCRITNAYRQLGPAVCLWRNTTEMTAKLIFMQRPRAAGTRNLSWPGVSPRCQVCDLKIYLLSCER